MSESSDGIGLIQTNMKQHLSITIRREGNGGTGISIIGFQHIVYISMAMADNYEFSFDLQYFSISFGICLLGWRLVRGAIEGRCVGPCAWYVGFGCSARNEGSQTSGLDGGGVVTGINQNQGFMLQGHRSPYNLHWNTGIDEGIHSTKTIEYANKFKSKFKNFLEKIRVGFVGKSFNFLNHHLSAIFLITSLTSSTTAMADSREPIFVLGRLSIDFWRFILGCLFSTRNGKAWNSVSPDGGGGVIQRYRIRMTGWLKVITDGLSPVDSQECDNDICKFFTMDTEVEFIRLGLLLSFIPICNLIILLVLLDLIVTLDFGNSGASVVIDSMVQDYTSFYSDQYELFVEVIRLLMMTHFVRLTFEIKEHVNRESLVYGSSVMELFGLFGPVQCSVTNTISKGEFCLSHPMLVTIMGGKDMRFYTLYWNLVTSLIRGTRKMRSKVWKGLFKIESPCHVLSPVVQTQIWVLFKWEDLWCSTLRQVMVSSATVIKYLLLVLGFCSCGVGVSLFTGVRKGARGFVLHVGSLWRFKKTCDLQENWYSLSKISIAYNLRWLQRIVSLNSVLYVNIVTLDNQCTISL